MENGNSLRELIRAESHKNKHNKYTDNRDFVELEGNTNSIGNALQIRSLKIALRSLGSKVLPFDFYYDYLIDYLLKDHFKGLEYLYNILADQHSKDLLVQILTYRVMGHVKYKLPLSNPQYWENLKLAESLKVDNGERLNTSFMGLSLEKHDLNRIGFPIVFYFTALGVLVDFIILQYVYSQGPVTIKAEEGDVVIDAGACWGDTALLFSHYVGNKGKVYSFEFIPSNIEIFCKNLKLNPHLADAIEIVQHPVWENSGKKLYFNDCGPASTVSVARKSTSDGETVTLSIDDLVNEKQLNRVDLIKMDIEGAEPFAIRGAEETIREFRPKLAIAVYHDLSDFYTITRYIESLELGYSFYLQHATIYSGETVLFASV